MELHFLSLLLHICKSFHCSYTQAYDDSTDSTEMSHVQPVHGNSNQSVQCVFDEGESDDSCSCCTPQSCNRLCTYTPTFTRPTTDALDGSATSVNTVPDPDLFLVSGGYNYTFTRSEKPECEDEPRYELNVTDGEPYALDETKCMETVAAIRNFACFNLGDFQPCDLEWMLNFLLALNIVDVGLEIVTMVLAIVAALGACV